MWNKPIQDSAGCNYICPHSIQNKGTTNIKANAITEITAVNVIYVEQEQMDIQVQKLISVQGDTTQCAQ